MRQRLRGWIMPEADMRAMLRLIHEKIGSPKIDVRHQDVLVRLRETLENDLEGHLAGSSAALQESIHEKGGIALPGVSSAHAQREPAFSPASFSPRQSFSGRAYKDHRKHSPSPNQAGYKDYDRRS